MKSYELSDHLGNVHVVLSDLRKAENNVLKSDVMAAYEYYPFGMTLQKIEPSSGYRFGFQGQERDPEWNDNYAFEYRIHDPRLGRFLSIDPLNKKFPYWSPYQFAGNQAIHAVELEGLETSDNKNESEEVAPNGKSYEQNLQTAANALSGVQFGPAYASEALTSSNKSQLVRENITNGVANPDAAQYVSPEKHAEYQRNFEESIMDKKVAFNTDTYDKNNPSISLVKGTPSEAMQDIANNPGNYRLDCAMHSQVIGLYASYLTIGSKAFDEKFLQVDGSYKFTIDFFQSSGLNPGNLIYYDASKKVYVSERPNKTSTTLAFSGSKILQDSPIGSRITLTNPSIPIGSPIRNDNFIKLGNGLYSAHPYGVVTMEQILQRLNREMSNAGFSGSYILSNFDWSTFK